MMRARGSHARGPWALGALVVAAVSAAVLGMAAWQRAGACGGFGALDARCLTVTVPENREAKSGPTISIRVVVLPATSEPRDPDPVFFLAGGPGQGASSLAAGHARSPLRATRDLVFADQRGTGGSNPLSCQFSRPEDWANGRPADFLPIDRVRECRASLARSVDLTQYTTAAAVADLEDVRAQLGYERINISGGSYGTRLAMEYVRAHPERVRAVLLDGAVAPSVAMPAGFGVSAQRTLDAVLDECAGDPVCAVAFPDIRTKAREVFARLERAPLRATPADGGPPAELTRDHVAEVIRYLTYTTAGASRIPQLLARAHGGDGAGLLEALRGQRLGNALGGLYLSVTCAEDVPFVDPAVVAQDRDTYLSDYRYRQQRDACAAWPRGSVPATHRTAVRSEVPVLLVTGQLDPATPPSLADEVAATLPNSLVVKVPFGGHGLNGLEGLGCVHALRVRFLQQGHVRGLDTSCLSQVRRSGFAR